MVNHIKQLRTSRGLSQQGLADLVGTSNQQISLLEAGDRQLTQHWMERISKALECRPSDLMVDDGDDGNDARDAPPFRGGGLSMPEIERFEVDDDERQAVDAIVAALHPGHSSSDLWTVKGRALEVAGYLPGDTVIVDLSRVDAKTGDVVCAQIYDWENPDKTRTVLRIFEPPYLVSFSADPKFHKPELVDNHIAVKGIVVASFRRNK